MSLGFLKYLDVSRQPGMRPKAKYRLMCVSYAATHTAFLAHLSFNYDMALGSGLESCPLNTTPALAELVFGILNFWIKGTPV